MTVGEGIIGNDSRAYSWSNGVTSLIPLPAGHRQNISRAASLDGGVIVGWATPNNNIGSQAWRYAGGVTTLLGDLPGGDVGSQATGVSEDGSVIVGFGSSASGLEAIRWVNGAIAGLVDLPGGRFESHSQAVSANGAVVVGYGASAASGPNREAFRWEGGIMQALGDLPGGSFDSFANDVSTDGSVVVGASASALGTQAFRWQGGVMKALGRLGTAGTSALGVSGDGSIVVGSTTGTPEEAVIWDEVHGMRSLSSVLQTVYGVNLNGLALTEATDISDDGLTIVGRGNGLDGQSRAWVAVIPAPGPGLALPAAGFAVVRRRRRP